MKHLFTYSMKRHDTKNRDIPLRADELFGGSMIICEVYIFMHPCDCIILKINTSRFDLGALALNNSDCAPYHSMQCICAISPCSTSTTLSATHQVCHVIIFATSSYVAVRATLVLQWCGKSKQYVILSEGRVPIALSYVLVTSWWCQQCHLHQNVANNCLSSAPHLKT